MINLKKLVYQYKYLKLDLDELKEQHIKLTTEFEEEFSDILKRDGNVEKEIPQPKKNKESKHADESVKDIYKKAAKQLHPDKGGNEEEFKELNDRYKSNDLLGVIDVAVDNKIDFDYKESDIDLMNNSIDSTDLYDLNYREAKDKFEKEYLIQKLKINNFNMTLTAKMLKLDRVSLYRKVKSLNIKID